MVTVRWFQGSALPDRKVRWYNGTATGAAGTPKVRWFNGSATGNANLTLRPIPDQTVEPKAPVTIPALLGATSPTPSGYVWRQVSGPNTPFQDNGASITFTSPAAVAGTVVVFGVTAQLGAAFSSESTATVTVYPHLNWRVGPSGWTAFTRQTLA